MNDLTLSNITVLTYKIFKCYNTDYSQAFVGPLNFTVQTNGNCVYADGAPVEITNASYSYSLIGRTNPLDFYFNGRRFPLNFYRGPIGQCIKEEIPPSVLAQINAGLSSARQTLADAETITSATPAADLIPIAQSSAETNVLAATALQSLINFNYPVSTNNLYSGILADIATAIFHHASATDTIANLLPGTSVDSADVTAVGNSLYPAVAAITEAAEAILNTTPTPSSQVLSLAQGAINQAGYAEDQLTQAAASPSFIGLLEPVLTIGEAIKALISALALLSENYDNATFIEDLQKLEILDSSISLSLEGIEATYDAVSPNPPADIITTAAGFFIPSADLTIIALTLQNIFEDVPYYTSFKADIQNAKCCGSSTSIPAYFIEDIDSFDVCSLNINVCGTIGCVPFKATDTLLNTQSIKQIGFNPINISLLIDVPCNTTFSIIQSLTPQLSVNCIVPTSTYDAASNSFSSNVISSLCLNADISVVTKEPVVTIVSPDTVIQCQKSYN